MSPKLRKRGTPSPRAATSSGGIVKRTVALISDYFRPISASGNSSRTASAGSTPVRSAGGAPTAMGDADTPVVNRPKAVAVSPLSRRKSPRSKGAPLIAEIGTLPVPMEREEMSPIEVNSTDEEVKSSRRSPRNLTGKSNALSFAASPSVAKSSGKFSTTSTPPAKHLATLTAPAKRLATLTAPARHTATLKSPVTAKSSAESPTTPPRRSPRNTYISSPVNSTVKHRTPSPKQSAVKRIRIASPQAAVETEPSAQIDAATTATPTISQRRSVLIPVVEVPVRMATPRSAESAITLQDAAEGVTEGVTESVTEESRGDDDIHIMSPTRNRSTARNLIIICSSPDEDPNDNMSDSTTALASPDAAVTTPPDDDGAEEEEEIIVVRSPAMRKRKGGVVLSSGDDDDMPVSKTATRSTTLHAAQTKTEESSAMKNASMDFDFGSDEDDDLPAAVDFRPATAVHQRVTPKHGTPLKSLEEIVESSDATKELAHVPRVDLVAEMLRKRQERKAASASTSTFRPDSPANRPLVSNTGRYSLSSLLKERQEKIRTGRTLEHIQAILDNKLERPPSPVKDESAAMDQLLDVDEDEKRRLGKELRNTAKQGRGQSNITLHLHVFGITIGRPRDALDSIPKELKDGINCSSSAIGMWSFAEASFLNDRIDQGMAVSEETSNHLLEQVMYCDDPSTVDSASEILARLIRRRAWSLPCNAFQLCMSKLGFTMSIAVIDSDATMASEVPDELRANNIAAVLGLLHESLSARPYASSRADLKQLHATLMLMSIDHRLRWITIDICPIIALIADLLKHASAENWHQTMDECYAMLKPGFLGNATHMRHLLYALPCTSPAMIDICRTLAFHFLHDMLGTTPRKSDAVAVVHVEDILMADPVFAISKHTDYEHLQNVLHFVDVCLGDQSFAASNVDSTKSIIARLTSINSRIADPRGAFLERTKVKDLLLRMCMRLSFAAEASKSGGGMPKRQSTIRFK